MTVHSGSNQSASGQTWLGCINHDIYRIHEKEFLDAHGNRTRVSSDYSRLF